MFWLVLTCSNLPKIVQTWSKFQRLVQTLDWSLIFFLIFWPLLPLCHHTICHIFVLNVDPPPKPKNWWRYLWTAQKPFRRVKSSLFSRRSHQFYFSTTSLSLRAKIQKINKTLILQFYIFLFFKQLYCQNNTFSQFNMKLMYQKLFR